MWIWMAVLAFIAFTAAEVAVLLELGGRLGVGWTLAWMVATALAGMAALRVGGLQAIVRIHRRLRAEELPTRELFDMGLTMFAAVCLIMPGFIADAIGLLLLLPPVRWLLRAVFRALYGELLATPVPPSRPAAPADDVIEIRPEP